MPTTMKATATQVGPMSFRARGGTSGKELVMDAAPEVGGEVRSSRRARRGSGVEAPGSLGHAHTARRTSRRTPAGSVARASRSTASRAAIRLR